MMLLGPVNLFERSKQHAMMARGIKMKHATSKSNTIGATFSSLSIAIKKLGNAMPKSTPCVTTVVRPQQNKKQNTRPRLGMQNTS